MIFVGDLHISSDRTRYSVLKVKHRKDNPLSKRFSQRLVHLIETVNWIDDLRRTDESQDVVQLGDIVSKANLDAEELQMIEEVRTVTQYWTAIRGNHGLAPNEHDSDCAVKFRKLYRQPTWDYIGVPIEEPMGVGYHPMNIVYLPYILEKDRKPLGEYLGDMDRTCPTLILSHNDVKGMKYGGITEKNGWSIEELEEWGDFIAVGHVHNMQWVSDKILIVGNVDGENLCEDYRSYPHGIWMFDEVAFVEGKPPRECVKFVQNPFAMKFANVEVKKEEDIERIKAESDGRTILAITVPESLADKAQELIDDHLAGGKKIVKADRKAKIKSNDNRVVVENHITKFKRCATEEYGALAVIEEI